MRRAGRGGFVPALLGATGALLAATPATAGVEYARTVVLEPQLGAALPAIGFVSGTVNEDYGADAVVYSESLAPAFLGGLHVSWLFPVGDGPGCCLVGPETGIDYVVWNPDLVRSVGTYYGDDDNLDAGRMRLLAGARVAGLWSWGWVLGRAGLGPEAASGWWERSGGMVGDVGVFFQVGFGVGFSVSDWFVLTLLADAVMTFHDHDEDSHPDGPADLYLGYRSLEFNLGVGFGFLL